MKAKKALKQRKESSKTLKDEEKKAAEFVRIVMRDSAFVRADMLQGF